MSSSFSLDANSNHDRTARFAKKRKYVRSFVRSFVFVRPLTRRVLPFSVFVFIFMRVKVSRALQEGTFYARAKSITFYPIKRREFLLNE
jgi:hypothetical protein